MAALTPEEIAHYESIAPLSDDDLARLEAVGGPQVWAGSPPEILSIMRRAAAEIRRLRNNTFSVSVTDWDVVATVEALEAINVDSGNRRLP